MLLGVVLATHPNLLARRAKDLVMSRSPDQYSDRAERRL
jgi:hypothetical protein